jgi:hypothetical protein
LKKRRRRRQRRGWRRRRSREEVEEEEEGGRGRARHLAHSLVACVHEHIRGGKGVM